MKVLKAFTGIVFFILISVGAHAQFGGDNELSFKYPMNNDEISVELFPNPTSDYLNVEILSLDEVSQIGFKIYNILGSPVNVEVEQINGRRYRLNVKDIAPGYYLLSINDEKAYKFLKR